MRADQDEVHDYVENGTTHKVYICDIESRASCSFAYALFLISVTINCTCNILLLIHA